MGPLCNVTACIMFAFVFWAGHLAGFFFAWSNPAMMGFAQTSPGVYVAAMQEINRSVQNPLFFALFFGMVPLAAFAIAITRVDPLITLAAALSIAGFLITVLGNVPMNETMDAWNLAALPDDTEIQTFRARWQMLNTMRAVLLSLAFGLGILALSPAYKIKGLLAKRHAAPA